MEDVKVTTEVVEQLQQADDNLKAQEILTGSQEVYVNPFGWLKFEWPTLGLVMEGERTFALFKHREMLKGELLSESQLRTILIKNKEWSEEEESILEELPKEIKSDMEDEEVYKTDYEESETQMLASTNEVEKEELNKKVQEKIEAFTNFQNERKRKEIKLLKLQQKKLTIFSSSLEQFASLEKIKLYAPQCIFIKTNDGYDYLWKSSEDFNKAKFTAARIIGLFNYFLNGVNVSFFGDTPGDPTYK